MRASIRSEQTHYTARGSILRSEVDRMRRSLALFPALALAAAGSAIAAPKVCVFVPNVVSGSPTYEQMVAGAKRAVAEVPGASY